MHLLVVGSSNTDMVIRAGHLPAPGETIIGKQFFMNPGGKGANQAVAAARLGGNVKFVCKTGNDVFGKSAIELFGNEGIDTSCMLSDPDLPSGVALITLDDNGENTIVVASGSNASLSAKDLASAGDVFSGASYLLMQLEIPLSTVEAAASKAAALGIPVILNPAPASPLPASLLQNISVITPNENEAAKLTGIEVRDAKSAQQAAADLLNRGVKTVIITMGSEGALVFDGNTYSHVQARKVKAVDTTAAGDIFNGALAVALSEGSDMVAATKFACEAAALSVTRMGAQASAPYRRELTEPTKTLK